MPWQGAGAGSGVAPSLRPKLPGNSVSGSVMPCGVAAPISHGCLRPLGCIYLGGLHPSSRPARIHGDYLPGCIHLPRGALLSRTCTHLPGCTHLGGTHPSRRGAPLSRWAPISGYCWVPRLWYGVTGDAQPVPGLSLCAALGALWARAGTQLCCARVLTASAAARASAAPAAGSRWRETGYF